LTSEGSLSGSFNNMDKMDFRRILKGEVSPYQEGKGNELEYKLAALATAAFLNMDVEDLFGEIPQKDIVLKVRFRTQLTTVKIPRNEAIEPMDWRSHTAPVTEQMVDSHELQSYIEAAVNSLTPELQEVLELVFFEGKTRQKIAEAWKVDPEKPNSIRERSVEQIREYVEQLEAKALRMLRHPDRSRRLRPFYLGF